MCPEEKNTLRSVGKRVTKQGKQYEERLNFFKKWLEDVPKLESHYRRKYTRKLYFQSDFKTYTQIYEFYSKDCESHKENGIAPISFPMFMSELNKQNFSIFNPRNDMCDICLSYAAKNVSQEQYDSHRQEIENMREEKINDIENAKSGLSLLLCIDMQAVKLLPQSNANASYYKIKLQIHNFTIYNVITHDSDNYVWDETEEIHIL